MTIRSMSHHLAAFEPGEVNPYWGLVPFRDSEVGNGDNLKLLLVPWPQRVDASSFTAQRCDQGRPDRFGFFSCDLRRSGEDVIARVLRLHKRASAKAGRIDGVVLPEMYLRPGEAEVIAERTGAFVIGGVGSRGRPHGLNAVVVALPVPGRIASVMQHKHHRWRIDSSQITQYGIGDRLSYQKEWWENFRYEERDLYFWNLSAWFSMCVLVCEDLARPDPAADLVRAVGPNLVIAILMDGPQLAHRWPARYATVLADDPGSSVLTLTSVGMAELSRVPDRPPSRAIALWKDHLSGPAKEIHLSPGSDGVVLLLKTEVREEFTADGRGDGGSTVYVVWNGFHEVRL